MFLRRALLIPQGDWDAWAIWNLRAKFLYAGSAATFNPALLPYTHVEYPILVPALVALGWRITGNFTPAVPILLHGLTLVTTLILLRRWLWAVALVGLVAAYYASMQYADVPLALALLAACAAWFSRRETLVGIALGLASLTKNEGALILVCFFAAWIMLERRVPLRAVAAAIPFLIVLAGFKAAVHVPNDIIGTGGALERALQSDRYALILAYIGAHTLTFGTNALPALAAILLVRGKRVVLSVPLAAVGLLYLGYIAVYVITPNPLEWHLTTSYDRLLMQLFPTLVFALASQGRMPVLNHST